MKTYKDSQHIKEKDYVKSISQQIKHGTFLTYHVYTSTIKVMLTVYTQTSSFALYLDHRDAKSLSQAFLNIESII